MPDREKVIRIIDELIFEAKKAPTWKAENALRCLKKELLKEQENATIWKCDKCGEWITGTNVVRCKDCKHWNQNLGEYCDRLNSYPGGEWFCANGEKRQ